MGLLATFIPIIILLIILLSIVSLFRLSRFHISARLQTYKLLVAYFSVLLVGIVIFAFLSAGREFEFELMSKQEVKDKAALNDQLYFLLVDGKWQEANDVAYKVKQSTFSIPSNQLTVHALTGDGINETSIFVEKTDQLTESIEVMQYQGYTTFRRIDISEKKELFTVDLVNKDLHIDEAIDESITDVALIHQPFTTYQFTGDGWFFNSGLSLIGLGNIYIRVPIGVDVIGEVIEVQE